MTAAAERLPWEGDDVDGYSTPPAVVRAEAWWSGRSWSWQVWRVERGVGRVRKSGTGCATVVAAQVAAEHAHAQVSRWEVSP